MKKINRITAGILAVAMCFTSQAVFAEHFNNPTTATAVTTTKYPSVSLPDNAVKKIDTEVKTVRSNTDTEEADKVIVATSIDELPAEIAEKNYYTADYFKENVVVCYDMTYYYYYLLHTPTNVFINTDDKIEIQLTDFIDMSNPRTTALTPPSRWYLVAGMSREDYGNREVTKSMQTMVLNEETTTTPVTTIDTEDTTMTSDAVSSGTDVTTVPTIDTTVPVTDTTVSTGKDADEDIKSIPFNKYVVLPSNYDNNEQYRKNRSYQSAEELPDDLKDFFADTDFSKEEVIVVPYVGLYFEEILTGVRASDKAMYVDLESDWEGNSTIPTIAAFRKVAFSVDKKYNLSTFESANIHIESVNKGQTTVDTDTTTETTTSTDTEESYEIEFGKSAVIDDFIDLKRDATGVYKIYAYHTADELPEELTEMFGDTDFDKEKVIAVQIDGKYYDETLKAVTVQGKTLKLDLECDWGEYDEIPALRVRKLAVFTIPNDNSIKNQMVEECEKISVNSKDIIHTTTSVTDTTDAPDSTTTTSASEQESFEVSFGKSAVIKDFICQDTFDGIYKIYAYHTAEELPEELTEMFGDTDFDKEKVIAVQIGGKYFDEVLKAVSVQGKTLKLELECDWGDNDSIPELYVRKLAVFTIPNDNNIKNQMVEECEKISKTSKDIIHTTTSVTDTTDAPDSTTTTVTSTPSITEEADLNGDGKVDVRDLMAAAQFIVGAIDKKYSFDVNGDGKSNILDLMIIAKSIVE